MPAVMVTMMMPSYVVSMMMVIMVMMMSRMGGFVNGITNSLA